MIESSSFVALVTGGSSGIGKSICEHFLSNGYTVISLSRRPSPITHPKLVDVRADLSTIEDVKRVADEIAKYSPTTLVLNAGASLRKRTEDVIVEDLDRQVCLSVTSGWVLTQACLPDDMARAVMFLAAPQNSFITGQTIFVCGGASLGGVNTLGVISAAQDTEERSG